MEKQEYQKMYEMEKSYWWFVGRRSLISKILARADFATDDIVDVGCGTGEMLQTMNKFGKVIGIDTADEAIHYCKLGGIEAEKGEATGTMLPDNHYDLVTAFDLLEHIEDDQRAIREFRRICKGGGRLILTIPAHNFLWSEHDIALQHKRRYGKKQIEKMLRDSGFKINKISYLLFFLFIPITIFRILQRISRSKRKPATSLIILPRPINSLLIKMLELEAVMLKRINFPIGVSILIIAEKI